MNLRQKIVTWWLERRARNSPNSDVVYHSTAIISTIDHPAAKKAIWDLLHSNETERLKAVVSAVVDNTDGDPFETLHTYNPWALKDEKIWVAILGFNSGGREIVQTALTHKEFRIHKAAASAVQTLKERSMIPAMLTGMAQHSKNYPLQRGRQNNDRWDSDSIDAVMRKIADDWQHTSEGLSAIPGLIAAFASTEPEMCKATYIRLLNELDTGWTNLEESQECISCLKAVIKSCNDTSIQQEAHDALDRIAPE